MNKLKLVDLLISLRLYHHALWLLLLNVVVSALNTGKHEKYSSFVDYFPFPQSIQSYNVRVDSLTGEHVTTGLLELIGGVPKYDELLQNKKRYSLQEIKKTLQCVSYDFDFDVRGAVSFSRLSPPTRRMTELICAWLETECRPWEQCQKFAQSFKSGQYNKDMLHFTGFGYWIKLYRIINGKFHFDWPWGIERITEPGPDTLITMFYYILDKVKGIPDSVFFWGEQQTVFPFNIPFPAITCSPSFKSPEFALPWAESFQYALSTYRTLYESNFSSEAAGKSIIPWERRISKVAYFSSMLDVRQIVFDLAASRPDLFEFKFIVGATVSPWNPESTEPPRNREEMYQYVKNLTENMKKKNLNLTDVASSSFPPGYVSHISGLLSMGHTSYNPGKYKYLLVMDGGFDNRGPYALSGRLASFLASGAVVLLQESEFRYHFSARLRPWVHYVPVSYSGADIVQKVEWLRKHNLMAKRIADNARNFARSYLRLEDYYCYIASLLETIGTLSANTKKFNNVSALQSFSPRPIDLLKYGNPY